MGGTDVGQRPPQQEHFDTVASQYQRLRTTDDEPVLYVRDHLPNHPTTALDVGAGTGRYTELLHKVMAPGSNVFASDLNGAMLGTLIRVTRPAGVHPVRCTSEQLPFAAASVDVVTTFNAVHHFDLGAFAEEARRILRPGGQLFVYTRTPSQNASSIWGRSFPGFVERESRLYTEEQLRDVLGVLGEVLVTVFSYERTATPARLSEQVLGHHYSTFSFYKHGELKRALKRFLGTLGGAEEVTWHDQNTLAHVKLPA